MSKKGKVGDIGPCAYVHNETFGFAVSVYCNATSKKLLEVTGQVEDFSGCDGKAYLCGGENSIFIKGKWVGSEKQVATLVHELFHVLVESLTFVGVPMTKGNDETGAYVLGWMVREVLLQLNRRRKGSLKKKLTDGKTSSNKTE